ncbi:potassium channel subfamily K member 16 [Amia ocellicauda]|uniref:potassium channel subfamily K member 16 n=1 Tax=Amia ocellicauda TaxID=2972642 RepID=UPI0034639F02
MAGRRFRTVLLVLGYLVYLLMGAAVFQALEQQYEQEIKRKTDRLKQLFLKNFTCLSDEAVETFVEMVNEAVRSGVNLLETNKTTLSNWDFSTSFFFVGSVVTTIGYGHLAPRTAGGQMFCVVFATFGIPLNLIFLNHMGKILSSWTERLGKRLYSRGMDKKRVKFLTIVFFLVVGILLFLALPPLLFCAIEHWSYREGVYYAFITLSTIGFGDYVVGLKAQKSYYRALVAVWILFGMAWLALLFNLLTTFYKDTEKKISKVHQKRKAAKANKSSTDGSELSKATSEDFGINMATGDGTLQDDILCLKEDLPEAETCS